MSQNIKIPSGQYGVQVTKYWNNGHYRFQVHGDLAQGDIVALFAHLDPAVRQALLKEWERKLDEEAAS